MCSVNDEPQITADADGPEVRVFRRVQSIELHLRTGGVQLQIEGGRHRELLLIAVSLTRLSVKVRDSGSP